MERVRYRARFDRPNKDDMSFRKVRRWPEQVRVSGVSLMVLSVALLALSPVIWAGRFPLPDVSARGRRWEENPPVRRDVEEEPHARGRVPGDEAHQHQRPRRRGLDGLNRPMWGMGGIATA